MKQRLMSIHSIILSAVLLGWWNGTSIANTASGAEILKETLAAHGGVERWQQQRSFSYTLNGFPLSPQVAKPNTSTVDLTNRHNRIVGEGFTVGYDGDVAWSSPGPNAVGLPARFFSLGSFYFIGMPFVFADPGVELKDLGTTNFEGRKFRLLKASYADKVGYTSRDDYILLIDPSTNRLHLIHHSVTEPQKAVKRVTWVFNEWQNAEGLLVPKKMTFYPGWQENTLPSGGTSFTIENPKFSSIAPDSNIYAKPNNAVIDDSPVY